MGNDYQEFVKIYLLTSDILLSIETMKPASITRTPNQTRFINGLTLASITRTSVGSPLTCESAVPSPKVDEC